MFLTARLDPPPGYLSPPTDIVGGLSTMRARAAANEYQSQYNFDADLFRLVFSANDGHFALQPCSTSLITWLADTALVSISSDGVQLPHIYTYGGSFMMYPPRSTAQQTD